MGGVDRPLPLSSNNLENPMTFVTHHFVCKECPGSGEIAWFHEKMYCPEGTYIGAVYPGTYNKDAAREDFARLLAHDALEHKHSIKCIYTQEIYANGRAFAHREHDFYNVYGHSGLPNEIAGEVFNLIQSGNTKRLPYSNADIAYQDPITDHWEEIKRLVCQRLGDEDIKEPDESTWSRLRRITWRTFAAGYQSVKRDPRFERVFYDAKENILDACDDLADHYGGEMIEGMKFTLGVRKGYVSYRIKLFED